jgi:arylsulfatase A-like enzyme
MIAVGRSLRVLVAVVLGATCLGACARRPRPDPRAPNIVLVFMDAMRADHLSCYGYARQTSPEIDRLAADGVRIGPIVAQAPATFPSVPSVFTSRLASWFFDAGGCVLEPRYLTLAEMLRTAGYETVGISSSPIVTKGRSTYSYGGFDQGFQSFDDSEAEGGAMNWQWRSPEAVVDAALPWLNHLQRERFFMLLYIEDPHDAYHCPEPYWTMFDRRYSGPPAVMAGNPDDYEQAALDGRPIPIGPRDVAHLEALYDGEIRYANSQLRRFVDRLRELGLLDTTLIVVTSDHGEEFADHGGFKHGYALYEETVRVPLVMSWPGGLPKGKVIGAPLVESIDIVPTILELAHVPLPAGLEGSSLVPLMTGEESRVRPFALSETPYADAKMITDGQWKLIERTGKASARPGLTDRYAKGSELYDLATDPHERRDLFATRPDVVKRLREAMWDMLPVKERTRLEAGEPLRLDPHLIERLRSLGYLR